MLDPKIPGKSSHMKCRALGPMKMDSKEDKEWTFFLALGHLRWRNIYIRMNISTFHYTCIWNQKQNLLTYRVKFPKKYIKKYIKLKKLKRNNRPVGSGDLKTEILWQVHGAHVDLWRPSHCWLIKNTIYWKCAPLYIHIL